VALYKEKGKHNQQMGLEPLFFASDNSVLHYTGDWQKTARIEHRIGATSKHYDPFLNMLFIIINVLEGIDKWQSSLTLPKFEDKALPKSLYDQGNAQGALTIFRNDNWFAEKIDSYCENLGNPNLLGCGKRITNWVLSRYQPSVIQ
jgi:hypothetical protein